MAGANVVEFTDANFKSEVLDAAGPVLVERRSVRFDGAAHDCPVWEREHWPAGAELTGPAIVEEFGATTVVPPGWRGRRIRVSSTGSLPLTAISPQCSKPLSPKVLVRGRRW